MRLLWLLRRLPVNGRRLKTSWLRAGQVQPRANPGPEKLEQRGERMNKTLRLSMLASLAFLLCVSALADTVFSQYYCNGAYYVTCKNKNNVAASGASWTCGSVTLGTTTCMYPSCSATCNYPPPVYVACGGGGGCGCYGCCGGCLLMDGD
jgi:hypothetical protein